MSNFSLPIHASDYMVWLLPVDFTDMALEREYSVLYMLGVLCIFFLFGPHSNPEAAFSPNFSLQHPEMFLFPKIPFSTHFSYASSIVYASMTLTCLYTDHF